MYSLHVTYIYTGWAKSNDSLFDLEYLAVRITEFDVRWFKMTARFVEIFRVKNLFQPSISCHKIEDLNKR